MLLQIDIREQDLIKQCSHLIETNSSYNNIKLETLALPLGDIIIKTMDGDEKLIIERKTVRDLASSIKDGRYKEQSYRLSNIHHPNHNIIYLIEGNILSINFFKDRIKQTALYSSIFSLNYYKGFSVIRTLNIEETSIFLCNMVNKMINTNMNGYYDIPSSSMLSVNNIDTNISEDDNNAFISSNVDVLDVSVLSDNKNISNIPVSVNNIINEKQYCSVVKKVKKDNVTVNNIGEIMLCQIPGVSSITALAIMKQFETISNLIAYIQEDVNCLDNIYITDTNNKQRKINKTAISSIIKYLSP